MCKRKWVLRLTVFITAGILSMIVTGCGRIAGSGAPGNGSGKDPELAGRLNEFLSAFNENSSYKYSGTVLVARGDEIILEQGYGMADYDRNLPNKPESVFAAGSITKSFTAAAILQLQEKGLLNVDDPVSKYVGGNGWESKVTLRQLLTHTSGLPRDGIIPGKRYVSLDENVESVKKQSLLFDPGKNFSYSNAGYSILAAIIGKVSGKSYNEYIRENIFLPLGMNRSRCGTDASYANGQSVGYLLKTGKPLRLSIYDLSGETGSGNIYSTAYDLYKYERGICNGKILSKESSDWMFSPQWGDWSSGYGYGWEITEKYGRKRFSHGGNIAGGGYVSLIIRYPGEGFLLVFLSNNADKTALNAVSGTMEAIVCGKEYVIPEKTEKIKPDPEVLKQYAGEYDFGEGAMLSVGCRDGKLYSTADDGNLYELIPITGSRFYFQDHQWVQDEFVRDRENRGITLKIHNAGRVFEGKKVK